MDTLVIALIAWIAAKSSLAAAADMPQIRLVPKSDMTALYRDSVNGKNYFRVEAFYRHANTTVYLPDNWQSSNLRERSVLVHELVHHLQAANNVRVSCPAALERQAYNLQFAWLREQGVADPYEFTGINVLTVILASTCPE